MPGVFLKADFSGLLVPGRHQPQFPCRIDWSDGITAGLAFCMILAGSRLVDLVSGNAIPLGSTTTIGNTPYGQGPKFDSTTSSAMALAGFAPLVTSTADGKGDFTAGCLHNQAASATKGDPIVGQGTATFTAGWEIDLNDSANDTATSGSIAHGVDATPALFISHTGCVDGNPHLFLSVRAGGVMSGYNDGVLQSIAQTSGTNSGNNSNILTASGTALRLGLSTTGVLTATVPWFAGWNRALAAAEILRVALDPWCFVTSQESELPALKPGAAPAFVPFPPRTRFVERRVIIRR